MEIVKISARMTDSTYLIYVPAAGQADPEQDLATIRGILQSKIDLELCLTTPDTDIAQLTQNALQQGCESIIAAGGDGTVSAVAGVLVGTSVPLGIIPRGTANAFAKALGIPTTIKQACQAILQGKPYAVDAASCEDKLMISSAGIGFEAEAIAKANRKDKDYLGELAYALGSIQELSKGLRPFTATLTTDDRELSLQACAITIANAAPPSSMLAQGSAEVIVDDGLLDVTIVAPADALDAIATAFDLLRSGFRRTQSDRPSVDCFRTRRLKVETQPPQKVILDGDLIGDAPIEVESIPGGLTLLLPFLPAQSTRRNQ